MFSHIKKFFSSLVRRPEVIPPPPDLPRPIFHQPKVEVQDPRVRPPRPYRRIRNRMRSDV